MADNQRREPARQVEVEDIDPQEDVRARVVGSVIDRGEESITVDDGTGTVEVFVEEEQVEGIEEGDEVRILGRVLPAPDGFELQAEALHSLEIDRKLHDRIKKVVNTTR